MLNTKTAYKLVTFRQRLIGLILNVLILNSTESLSVVLSGYYAVLPSSAQSDLSHLHRHLLDIKSLVSAMSPGSLSTNAASGGASSRQTDDRLVVAVKQSDSSTL